MSVNPNGEAEVLKVYFKPRPRLKKLIVDLNFGELAIKGRQSQGNLFTRYAIHKIVLKERGASTLGGISVWYDDEIRRLNTDGRGELLGEFSGDDRLIVMTGKGLYYTTGYDLGVHFPEETIRVEKYDPGRIYSVVYFDGEQNYYYVKRFTAEPSDGCRVSSTRRPERRSWRSAATVIPGCWSAMRDTMPAGRRYDRRGRVHRRQESPGQRQARDDARGRPDRLYRSDRAGASSRGTVRRGRSGDGSSGEGAGTDAASARRFRKGEPGGEKAEPKNYVAGDTVEFDVAGEEESGNGRQMELF